MTADLGVIPPPPGGYEPVVVDWLAGHESPTDVSVGVTMLDLARQGVLALSWRETELVVARVRAGRNDFEALVLDLLFNRVARDREEATADQVGAWIAERAEQTASWWRCWEEAVTQHALGVLRGSARGIRLPRRNPRRDRDQLSERWQEWADQLAATARAAQRHPDMLAQWARALLHCVPLGRAVEVAARIERDLSPSERDAVVGEWCPVPAGASLSEGLAEVLRVLPRLHVVPARD